jgi:iron-sulfur cluster assembly protein
LEFPKEVAMIKEITITDCAVEKIKQFLVQAEEGRGLRVKVVAGGCSGFEYRLDIDSPAPEDQVFEKDGARVLLDPKSFIHLSGSELDYKNDLMHAGFVFNNPNAKQTCGCGTSFTI